MAGFISPSGGAKFIKIISIKTRKKKIITNNQRQYLTKRLKPKRLYYKSKFEQLKLIKRYKPYLQQPRSINDNGRYLYSKFKDNLDLYHQNLIKLYRQDQLRSKFKLSKSYSQHRQRQPYVNKSQHQHKRLLPDHYRLTLLIVRQRRTFYNLLYSGSKLVWQQSSGQQLSPRRQSQTSVRQLLNKSLANINRFNDQRYQLDKLSQRRSLYNYYQQLKKLHRQRRLQIYRLRRNYRHRHHQLLKFKLQRLRQSYYNYKHYQTPGLAPGYKFWKIKPRLKIKLIRYYSQDKRWLQVKSQLYQLVKKRTHFRFKLLLTYDQRQSHNGQRLPKQRRL